MRSFSVEPKTIEQKKHPPHSPHTQLGDFGLAVPLAPSGVGVPPGVDWEEGDGRYAAPELLTGTHPPSPAADVFSLGASLVHVLTGGPLTPRAGLGVGDPAPSALAAVAPPALASLVAACVAADPSRRPTAAAVAAEASRHADRDGATVAAADAALRAARDGGGGSDDASAAAPSAPPPPPAPHAARRRTPRSAPPSPPSDSLARSASSSMSVDGDDDASLPPLAATPAPPRAGPRRASLGGGPLAGPLPPRGRADGPATALRASATTESSDLEFSASLDDLRATVRALSMSVAAESDGGGLLSP